MKAAEGFVNIAQQKHSFQVQPLSFQLLLFLHQGDITVDLPFLSIKILADAARNAVIQLSLLVCPFLVTWITGKEGAGLLIE
ncbi:MAG: hypothetical protein ACR5K6_03925 [Wolbachia sp.]